MATNKRLFIYATFIISCGAVALTVTAFATQFWISSELKPAANDTIAANNDVVNYGLFSGTLTRKLFSTTTTFHLYITCMAKENICVWTCNPNSDERPGELEDLFTNGTFTVKCTSTRAAGVIKRIQGRGSEENLYRKKVGRLNRVADKQFLNSALRISTIVFLSIALLFAVTGAVFAVINSATTPIELITGIYGLYIWNSVAFACDVIVLILWGAHFAATLTDNIAYTEVVDGTYVTKGFAMLGYSYWFVLGATLMHAANLTLLRVRKFLIDREPEQKTVELEANDGDIFLY